MINIDQYRHPERYVTQQGCFIAVHRYHEWTEPLSNVSAAIRLFDNSFWNHTAIALIRADGTIMVMESNSKGVVWMPFTHWAERYGNKIWQIYPPLKPLELEDYTRFLGRGYDYKSLLLWQPIYKTTGQWLGQRDIDGTGRTYCTEIFSYANELDRPYLLATGDIMEEYRASGIEPIMA